LSQFRKAALAGNPIVGQRHVVRDKRILLCVLPLPHCRDLRSEKVDMLMLGAHSFLEYEAVGKREAQRLRDPRVNRRCYREGVLLHGKRNDVHFWVRPFLPDPDDEFLPELAVGGAADAIVTHNVRHFAGVEQVGLRLLTPREVLGKIEGESL
jgi:hypothetical protein